MATDNVQADLNTSSGQIFSTLADATDIQWPNSVVCYAVTLDPGPPAANVLQIVTAANPLPVDGSGVEQPVIDQNLELPQGSTTSGQVGPLIQGAVTTVAPTYTTGQTSPISLTTAGEVRVAVTGGGGGTASAFGAAFPITGTAIGASNGTDMEPLLVDGSGFLKVNVAAGTVAATQSGAWTVTVGAALPAGSNVIGAVTQSGSWTVTANAGTGTFGVSGTVTANIGTTNGLALDSSINGILVAQGSTTSGEVGPLVQGAVTTASPSYTTAKTSPLSLTLAGALRVDASATTQPISGTVTANAGTGTFTVSGTVAATQSGTWTVQPGNTANTTPWLTTISQGGNSATVSAGGALKVDNSAVTQPVSGTVTINAIPTGSNTIGNVTVTDPAGTSGTITAADVASSTAAGATGQTLVTGTPTANSSVSVAMSGQSSIQWQVTGTWSATLQFEQSMDGGTTWVAVAGVITGVSTTAPITTSTTNGVFNSDAGAITNFRVRCSAFTSGTATVKFQPGYGNGLVPVNLVAGASVKAAQNGSWTIVPVAGISLGATPFRLISAATTNATSVKATAGNVYSVTAGNTNAAARFLKFYDKASAPTVGTDTPVQTYLIPGNTAGANMTLTLPVGMSFANGVALAITGAMADNDTTSISAGDVCVAITYK